MHLFVLKLVELYRILRASPIAYFKNISWRTEHILKKKILELSGNWPADLWIFTKWCSIVMICLCRRCLDNSCHSLPLLSLSHFYQLFSLNLAMQYFRCIPRLCVHSQLLPASGWTSLRCPARRPN